MWHSQKRGGGLHRLRLSLRLVLVRRVCVSLVALQLAAVERARARELETSRRGGLVGGRGRGAAAPRAPSAAPARALGPRGALRVRGLLRYAAALRPDASGARRPARVRRSRALHLHRRMH